MTEQTIAGSSRRASAEDVLGFVREHFGFGRSSQGAPILWALGQPHIALFVDDKATADRIALEFYDAKGVIPTGLSLAAALATVAALSARGVTRECAVRFAKLDGKLLTDLGRSDGRFTRTSEQGWKVRSRSRRVLFARTSYTDELPIPLAGGDVVGYLEQTTIPTEDIPLLLSWLVASLDPTVSKPILTLIGPPGAGKSVTMDLICSLVDPIKVMRWAFPTNSRDWAAVTTASAILPFDNFDGTNRAGASDLCRTSTGGAALTRGLYMNSGTHAVAMHHGVVLTTTGAYRAPDDLASRMLPIDVPPIAPRKIRSEPALLARARDLRPSALGGLLDLAAAVLAVMPEVEVPGVRMAHFAQYAAAVDRVMGTSALDRYRDSIARMQASQLERVPLLRAVLVFVEARGGAWEGNATALIETLREAGLDVDGCTPGQVGRLLRSSTAQLAAAGVNHSTRTASDASRARIHRLAPID
jgi:hypothetical protein